MIHFTTALSVMLASWVPEKERGKIGTIVFGGGQVWNHYFIYSRHFLRSSLFYTWNYFSIFLYCFNAFFQLNSILFWWIFRLGVYYHFSFPVWFCHIFHGIQYSIFGVLLQSFGSEYSWVLCFVFLTCLQYSK